MTAVDQTTQVAPREFRRRPRSTGNASRNTVNSAAVHAGTILVIVPSANQIDE